jgi:hypothetical protein
MENYLLSFGLGYLVGLAVLGYAVLLKAIKLIGKKYGFSKFIISVATLLHYVAGLLGLVYVPAFFYSNYLRDGTAADGVVFAVTGIVTISIVFFILSKWDDIGISSDQK